MNFLYNECVSSSVVIRCHGLLNPDEDRWLAERPKLCPTRSQTTRSRTVPELPPASCAPGVLRWGSRADDSRSRNQEKLAYAESELQEISRQVTKTLEEMWKVEGGLGPQGDWVWDHL